MTDGMIYHGVRKQELLKIIERSGLNFEEATSNFGLLTTPAIHFL